MNTKGQKFHFHRILLLAVFLFTLGFGASGQYYPRASKHWGLDIWSTKGCDTGAPKAFPNNTNSDVYICEGKSIVLDKNRTIKNLTIEAGAVLHLKTKHLTVTGNLVLNGSIYAGSGTMRLSNGTIIKGGGVFSFSTTGHVILEGHVEFSGSNIRIINTTGETALNISSPTGVVTNNGKLTIKGKVIGGTSATFINATNPGNETYSEFSLDGSFHEDINLNANAIGNTVTYSSSNNLDLKIPIGNTYYNLILAGSSIKSINEDLNISGDLMVNSGSFSPQGQTLSLAGNWFNNGNFIYGTSKVIFNGTTNQKITSTSPESFFNLKTFKASGELILDNNIEVRGGLEMHGGIIDAQEHILTIGYDKDNTGTLDWKANHVEGKLRRWINYTNHHNKEIHYPVGSDKIKRSFYATYSFSNTSEGAPLTVSFNNSAPGDSGLPLDDITQIARGTFVDGYWATTDEGLLDKVSSYNLSLDGNNFKGYSIADEESVRLLSRVDEGSSWSLAGTHENATGSIAHRSNITTTTKYTEYCFASTIICDPFSPLSIVGDTDVCTNEELIYIANGGDANSTYIWTFVNEAGELISQNNNEATISWGSTGALETLKVQEDNHCSISEPTSIDIKIHAIAPSRIDGDMAVPVSQSGEIYTAIMDDNYSYTFDWNVVGGIITDDNNETITIDWNSDAGDGTITVSSIYADCASTPSIKTETTVLKYESIESINDGNWDDLGSGNKRNGATWNCRCKPKTTDNVIIKHEVIANWKSTTINNVTIEAEGKLISRTDPDAQFINITGDLINFGHIVTNIPINLTGTDTYLGGVNGKINNNMAINITAGNKIIEPSAQLSINGGNVNIAAGLSVTNNGSIELEGTNLTGFDETSIWINGENATLVSNQQNIISNATLVASAINNTVHYNGMSNQNIFTPSGSNYYNLILSENATKSQNTNLNVLGDLTINSDANYDPKDFELNLGGNWTNNGTFVTGNTSISLIGSEEQNINSTSTENFFNLTVNKSNGAVILGIDLNVLNSLSMQKGNIDAGSNDKLISLGTIGSEGILNHASGTIIGKFKRYLTTEGTKLFPMGTSSSYNAMNIEIPDPYTAGSLTAQFIPSDPGSTAAALNEDGLDITDHFTDGYWTLEAGDGIATGNYNVNVLGNGFSSFPLISATRIISRENNNPINDWTLDGTHTNAADNTVYRNGLSAINTGISYEFGLGNTDCAIFGSPTITGLSDACAKGSEVYSVPFTAGRSYEWNVEKGTFIPGANPNEIRVDWQETAAALAYVRVAESSTCYDAPESEKEVTLHSLPTSSITGPTNIFDDSQDWNYSVTPRPGYTYEWDIDNFGTIDPTLQGNSNMTIDFSDVDWKTLGVEEVNATITVVGSYGCENAKANPVTLEVTIFKSYYTISDGNWSDQNTWEDGDKHIPTEGDNVKIRHNVNFDNLITTLNNLFIESGGNITHPDPSNSYTLTITENYKNDGIHDLKGGDLIVSGSISGIGSIENVATTSLNNSFDIFESTNLKINGNVTIAGNFIGNRGTIDISGNLSATTGFWNNEANATLKVGGSLFASGGTLFATATNNTVEYAGSGNQTIFTPNSNQYYNLTLSGGGNKSLASNLRVSGDLTIADNSNLSLASNTLSLLGAWNLGADAAFDASNAKVVFQWNHNQNLTTNNHAFKNLDISTANANTITLNDNLTITGNLNLNRGYIESATGKELIISATGNTNGGDLDSFVDGPVRKIGNTDFLFPVGDGSNWAPIEIKNAGGQNINDEFVAQYFNAPPANQDQLGTSGLDNISAFEYWNLNRDQGSATKDVILHWKNAQRSYIEDLSDLRVAHYNSAVGVEAWEDYGGTANGATGAGGVGSVTAPGVTNFSPFTFASASGANPLPIELLNFTGKANNFAIDLFWTTASELNNDYFEIQHSVDGLNFYTVGKEFGSGNSSVEIDYTFTHYTPSAGINYYRLKQVDYDGAFEIHKTIAIEYTSNKQLENDLNFKLYPNPHTAGSLAMEIMHNSAPQMADVIISDLSGNAILMKKVQLASQEKVSIVPGMIDGLKPGMYLVSIITHKQKITNKLIVN